MTGAAAIYPTWRGVGLVAAGAPVATLASLFGGPDLWTVSLLWIAVAVSIVLLDAMLGSPGASMEAAVTAPGTLEAGRANGEVHLSFGQTRRSAVQVALEAGTLLDVQPTRQAVPPAAGTATFRIVPRRRGRTVLRALHLRWRGPLGLVWKQRIQALARTIDIVPNVSAVRDEALRLFSRTRETGAATQIDRATSMEFHALKEFQAGDDSRSVNWRQSARHQKLLVRETRAERNRTIIFAFDTGRLMCEPLDGGLPRIDHAINAALLMAYVGLKVGDRVGLFAFDARPRISSAATMRVDAFAPLQRAAAAIDYTREETNFTLGLSHLASTLHGRSLIVLFTEFADSTGAALMVDSIGHLLERHLVLFVAFHDQELESLVRAEPRQPADVSRAVVAGGLLREREVVLGRLRRLGVEVLNVPARAAGPALLRRYLALKREDRL